MNKNKTLEQLYAEHSGKVSDKWSIYLVEYGRIFCEYRDRPVNFLEIGVQNGGSLEIWSKFFPNAQKLVGCDINPDCSRLTYEDSRIVVVVGDANLDSVQSQVLQHAKVFDVMLDDGSHRSSDIVKSFAKYFPYLADGGVFVAEDLHCSYWADFEGGLFDPFSSITFFKRLADIINHEHWGIAKSRSDILRGFYLKYDFQIDEEVLAHIHSIEFINSMCVIRKDMSQNNALGSRFISGQDESIVPGSLELQSTSTPEPSQIGNAWTARIKPPDEDVLRLETELATCKEDVLRLETELATCKEDVLRLETELVDCKEETAWLSASRKLILNSISWRITKPLRFVWRQVKQILSIFGI